MRIWTAHATVEILMVPLKSVSADIHLVFIHARICGKTVHFDGRGTLMCSAAEQLSRLSSFYGYVCRGFPCLFGAVLSTLRC
jgi:hypothetical protein